MDAQSDRRSGKASLGRTKLIEKYQFARFAELGEKTEIKTKELDLISQARSFRTQKRLRTFERTLSPVSWEVLATCILIGTYVKRWL